MIGRVICPVIMECEMNVFRVAVLVVAPLIFSVQGTLIFLKTG